MGNLQIAFTIIINKNIIRLSITDVNTTVKGLEGLHMRISGVTYAVRKTHRTRKIILTVIVLLLLAVLAVVIFSGYKSWGLLHPDKKPLDTFTSNIVPEYKDIPSFGGVDKTIILKGWLFQAKNSDRAVVLVHSYGSNRLQFGVETVDLIKEFLKKGYTVFTFDLRNSGESGGKDSTFGYNEKDDVKGAVKYLNNQGYKYITLMGFSTGASASILAATELDTVDVVIADSPYSDLHSYFLESLDQWTNLPVFPFNRTVAFGVELTGNIDTSKASPVNAMTAENPPNLMLIHAKEDTLIPVTNSIELFQKYSALNSSGVEFWQVEGDGHADSYTKHKDEYLNRVFAFLDKVYPEEE